MPSLDDFLHRFFRDTYWVREGSPDPRLIRTVIAAADLWRRPPDALLDDRHADRFGEYTIDPGVNGFEGVEARIMVPEPPDGGIVGSVAHDLVDAYDSTHRLAGIAYWHWLAENPGNAPSALKDERQYYLAGSLLRDGDGNWTVPSIRWSGVGWALDCSFLTQLWAHYTAAVLIER